MSYTPDFRKLAAQGTSEGVASRDRKKRDYRKTRNWYGAVALVLFLASWALRSLGEPFIWMLLGSGAALALIGFIVMALVLIARAEE